MTQEQFVKMKHLTTILAAVLCAVCLSGCEDNSEQKQQAIDANIASHITGFNYKGHHYLLYKQVRDRGGYCGMVHDPDCPCHKEGGEG